jgi:RimJ/RimL family protein N-acetyltransferase
MLSGELVELRALERVDLPQLLEWRNAPTLRRFFRERHELGMDDQLAWFERVTGQRGRPRDTLMFAIERIVERDLVGACGLCYIDWISATAELSVYIGAQLAYVDAALAPDACRTLIGHAFDELNLRRLWVEVFAFDRAKATLLETLGFVLEGTLREHRFHAGAYHDSLMYGLLRG